MDKIYFKLDTISGGLQQVLMLTATQLVLARSIYYNKQMNTFLCHFSWETWHKRTSGGPQDQCLKS